MDFESDFKLDFVVILFHRQQKQGKTMKKESTNTEKNSVRFHNDVKVKRILHVMNYTDDEIEACWYSREEYMKIQKGVSMTLDLMKLLNANNANKNKVTSLSFCTRGLEDLSSEERRSKRIRRHNAVWAVLHEQDRQDDDGGDGLKIRELYRNYSRVSENNAHSIGLIDSVEASVVNVISAAIETMSVSSSLSAPSSSSYCSAINENNQTLATPPNPPCYRSLDLFRRGKKRWSFTRVK